MAAAEPAPAEAALGPLTPRPRRVLRRRRETHDTVTLELEPASGWRPGQFNMLYAFGTGEVPVSICGDPDRHDRLLHTVRDVGLATAGICRLRPGDRVGVRGPFGSAWPLRETAGRDVLVVAGGLGMAPLRPVLYPLARRPRGAGRVTLLYGARTPADLLYTAELRRMAAGSALDLHLAVDSATTGWTGRVGVVPALLDRAAFDPANVVAMICGPEVMMRFAVAGLRRLGVPDRAVWLSMERNMHCAVGFCGHCQLGPAFVCRDGPVFRLDAVSWMLDLREV